MLHVGHSDNYMILSIRENTIKCKDTRTKIWKNDRSYNAAGAAIWLKPFGYRRQMKQSFCAGFVEMAGKAGVKSGILRGKTDVHVIGDT